MCWARLIWFGAGGDGLVFELSFGLGMLVCWVCLVVSGYLVFVWFAFVLWILLDLWLIWLDSYGRMLGYFLVCICVGCCFEFLFGFVELALYLV